MNKNYTIKVNDVEYILTLNIDNPLTDFLTDMPDELVTVMGTEMIKNLGITKDSNFEELNKNATWAFVQPKEKDTEVEFNSDKKMVLTSPRRMMASLGNGFNGLWFFVAPSRTAELSTITQSYTKAILNKSANVVAVYSDMDADTINPLKIEELTELAVALNKTSVHTLDIIYRNKNTYKSIFCEDTDCCPAEGREMPELVSEESLYYPYIER